MSTNWPFERHRQRGLSLFEVVLSLALVSLMLGSIYSGSVFGLRAQTGALRDLQAAEMALSVLEEYRLQYPDFPLEGTYKDRWSWVITDVTEMPPSPAEIDRYFRMQRVTVTIQDEVFDGPTYSHSTLIARRGPDL